MGYFGFCATFPPLTDVFIAVQFCFSVREMDVKRGGGGFHINLSIHPFHSPKRLRLQWRDQGYKATRNPPNAAKKKKLQTASAILTGKNLEPNFLFAL